VLPDIHDLGACEQPLHRGGGDVYTPEGVDREARGGRQGGLGQSRGHHPWWVVHTHHPKEVTKHSLFVSGRYGPFHCMEIFCA